MTRVSDALERAARNSGAEPRVTPDAGMPLPVQERDELWPSEGLAVQPTPTPEPGAELLLEQNEPRAAGQAALGPLLSDAVREKLVTGGSVAFGVVEQYRRLGARLHLAQAERGTRIVMVTSGQVGEGKTLTATNLALTLSESYKRRVLLIDADLRRPWIHELFKLPNLSGLNDGVRSAHDRKVPLIRVSDHLSVLTAGRPDPDPMSVLASDRMRRVLADASRSFDWVIIDTPPIGLLGDAHLLANLVDTVVLVVKAGVTPLRAMQQAVDAVGRDRIIGVVLNCMEDGTLSGADQYYNYARTENVAGI